MYGEADPSLFPEIHRFVVPEGCHWNDVRDVATNVGAALRRAMQEIERANPDTLFRVFGNADWGDKEKFSDELLKDLIEGFARIGLGNSTAKHRRAGRRLRVPRREVRRRDTDETRPGSSTRPGASYE